MTCASEIASLALNARTLVMQETCLGQHANSVKVPPYSRKAYMEDGGNVIEQKSMQDLRRSWKAFILGMREMHENMRPSLEMYFDIQKASRCITITFNACMRVTRWPYHICMFV